MKKFYALAILVMITLFVSGCRSTIDTEVTTIDKDGKTVTTKTKEDFPSIAKKSLNITTQSTAFKVSTVPDTSGMSLSLIFGTFMSTVHDVVAVKPGELTERMFTLTSQGSIFSMFGTDIKSITISYTGQAGESAEDTIKVVNTLKEVAIAVTASSTSDTASKVKP